MASYTGKCMGVAAGCPPCIWQCDDCKPYPAKFYCKECGAHDPDRCVCGGSGPTSTTTEEPGHLATVTETDSREGK